MVLDHLSDFLISMTKLRNYHYQTKHLHLLPSNMFRIWKRAVIFSLT